MIKTFPAEIPVTIPVIEFTVAIDTSEDDQTPPAVVLVNCVVAPTHALVVPLIEVSVENPLTFTIVCVVDEHPLEDTEYVIVDDPAVKAVTTPLASIVATAVLLDVHTPPGVELANVDVDPAHTCVAPVIAANDGTGSIVTVVVSDALHPFEETVYVIDAFPADIPVTTPVIEFTVATAVLLDDQTPPEVALDNCVVAPTHALVVPVIAGRDEGTFTFTVVCAVDEHPFVVTVYVIVVEPADKAVTAPVDASTVATAVLLDVQTPPDVTLVSDVVNPSHTCVVPVIAATTGNGFTVTEVSTD